MHIIPGLALKPVAIAVIEQFTPFERGVDLSPVVRMLAMRRALAFARSLPQNRHLRHWKQP
jgi:hypothetical protein